MDFARIRRVILLVALFGSALALGTWLAPPVPRLFGAGQADADSETMFAEVVSVLQEGQRQAAGYEQPYQLLEVEVAAGPRRGERFQVEHGGLALSNVYRLYRPGDQVVLAVFKKADGREVAFVNDFVRLGPMALLAALFVGAVLLVSRWQGVRALVGLGVSLLVIIRYILPYILAGADPVLVCTLGSCALLFYTLYIVYGWRPKTHIAVLGTWAALLITSLLAWWFAELTRLSGFGSDESMLLQTLGVQIDPRGLVLAGVIVGALGVLDDVTISQSSAVFELYAANPRLSWPELYRRGMNIGRDHIASMVNTLVLAYVGASLPLLLLLWGADEPFLLTLNGEFIAEEVVRTLVGSLGLVSAVSVTTLLASWATRLARQLSPTAWAIVGPLGDER
jgi:uncharacterized membrane protein